MQRLIEVANKIEDKELREKVISFLKDPRLSHRDFKRYPREKIERVKTPFTVSNIGTVEREDLTTHLIAVTELCVKAADVIEKYYDIKINRDYLIAGSILHDLMKIFEWRIGKQGPEHTGILLDHSTLGVAELYARGFPEQVIHLVASHFGESGPTPPRNFEALILHYVDSLLSLTEFHLHRFKQQPLQLVVLDEKVLKKLEEETGKKFNETRKIA